MRIFLAHVKIDRYFVKPKGLDLSSVSSQFQINCGGVKKAKSPKLLQFKYFWTQG